jgi:putative heme-binding domain-containing protein
VLTNSDVALNLLARIARNPELDQWQVLAIISSAGPRPWALGEKLRPMLATATQHQLTLLERLSGMIGANENSADANHLLWWLSAMKTPNRFVVLTAALDSAAPARREQVATPFMESARVTVTDGSLPERLRIAAIRVASSGREDTQTFATLLSLDEPDSIQVAAGKALFDLSDSTAASLVFSRWSECSQAARRQLIPAAARQTRSAAALLDAVERGVVSLPEVDATTRQSLEKSTDPAVKQRASKLFAAAVSADREALVEKFRPALKLAGDRRNGAVLFERNCALCHQMQGVGAKIGPDLSGTGQQPRETLLVQILDPSRRVLPDFVAYTAETNDGETYNGFIAGESGASVTLRRPNEPDITLPRSRIVSLKTNGRSLMPDGLEADMTEQDMADLIEFLRRPDRTLFYEKSKIQEPNSKLQKPNSK